MADVTIRINTDNAAFHPLPGWEVARILRRLADCMQDDSEASEWDDRPLLDVNGNRCGSIEVAED